MLLSILGLSAILPAIRIDALRFDLSKPEQKTVDETLYITASPVLAHERTIEPADEVTPVVVQTVEASAPVQMPKADVKTRVALGVRIFEAFMQMNIVSVLTYLYLVGVAFFMIRLLIGIVRAETLCRLGGRRLSDGSKLLVCDGEFQPTSWRRTVILSRTDFESDNSRMIIEHEQAHIRCRHSIDVVLAQTVCALQWFNPAAWALKRTLQEVHEFEADATVLADGYDERQYQICLVQAALGGRIGFVTSNFADCSTKKRITMMRTSQSSPFVCLRALLMLPVILFAILLASACKPKATQEPSANAQSELLSENTLNPAAGTAAKPEPLDTTFMKKFGLGANQDLRIKQLNIFVEIEWDGAIWLTFDGEQTFHPATLDNFAAEFERLKKESTVEVARPDLVFVACANDAHLDIAQNIIKQLQKSYSDDKIILITLPGKKTVPPPPGGYAIDYNSDKCVEVEVSRRNGIHVVAYNVTRILNSPQELRPTIDSFATSAGTDSVAIEIRADGTVLVKVPKLSYDVDTPEKLKALLLRLYPGADEKVFYKVEYRFATSSRLVNEVEHVFTDSPDKYKPFTAKPVVKVLPSMSTRQDSIKHILLGKYGSGADRSRHVKDMKWYNENKDKEEFFRMGFRNGQIYVGKGDDISNMRPIEFDQLVPYFRENCPGGDERKAIVLFEINQDGTVSVAYMDKVLDKMERWITTFTRRIWVSDKPVGRPNVAEEITITD
ncbi:MAG: hypothetical protein IJU24_09030 [Bacteroidaceae bacterium]|nr:hypothetical protein [Bacteroidaceae bacterium]